MTEQLGMHSVALGLAHSRYSVNVVLIPWIPPYPLACQELVDQGNNSLQYQETAQPPRESVRICQSSLSTPRIGANRGQASVVGGKGLEEDPPWVHTQPCLKCTHPSLCSITGGFPEGPHMELGIRLRSESWGHVRQSCLCCGIYITHQPPLAYHVPVLFFFIHVLFFSKIFFFLCGPFFKSLLTLSPYCFCFMFRYFGHKACGISTPQPGTEPIPPALEGKVSTTGPLGKTPSIYFQSICVSIFKALLCNFFPTLFALLLLFSDSLKD